MEKKDITEKETANPMPCFFRTGNRTGPEAHSRTPNQPKTKLRLLLREKERLIRLATFGAYRRESVRKQGGQPKEDLYVWHERYKMVGLTFLSPEHITNEGSRLCLLAQPLC